MHTCVCVCMCAHALSAGACGGQGPLDPLELELQVTVGCLKQMPGTKLGSSA